MTFPSQANIFTIVVCGSMNRKNHPLKQLDWLTSTCQLIVMFHAISINVMDNAMFHEHVH